MPSGLTTLFTERVTMTPRDPVSGLPGPTFEVDASIDEDHSTKVSITRHPVYKGIPVADNSRPEPDVLTMTAFFSDAKTSPDEALEVAAAALASGTAGTPTVFETYALMVKYAKEGALWSVTTSLRAYDNMALETLSAARSAAIGYSLQLPLLFTEIRTATLSIDASVKVPKRGDSQGAKKSKGPQAVAPASAAQVQKTGAAGLADVLFKGLGG